MLFEPIFFTSEPPWWDIWQQQGTVTFEYYTIYRAMLPWALRSFLGGDLSEQPRNLTADEGRQAGSHFPLSSLKKEERLSGEEAQGRRERLKQDWILHIWQMNH